MTNRNCGSCRHFYPHPANLKTGHCRESSPVPIAVGMSKAGPVINGYHPPVGREHVCGKWQLKLELPQELPRPDRSIPHLGQVNGGEG